MELLKPKIKDYPGQPSRVMAGKHIKIEIDNPDLGFAEAKDLAKQKQKNFAQIRCCCPGTRAKPGNRIRICSAVPATNRHGLFMQNLGAVT